MATQGQDASEVVRKIAAVIKARQKGQALEDAIEATFAPQQQVPPAGAPANSVEQPSPAPEGMPAGGALPGMPMMEGAPMEQPDIQTLLSSLSGSGAANASVRTSRRS
jgi:hypothetical protein